jgi:hypothetical protein
MPLRRRDQNLRLVVDRRWQFWRRRAGRSPEFEEDEHLYRDLGDHDPGEAERLTRRFAERWLASSSLPERRLGDALAATRLEVADDEEAGTSTLRLSFDYMGSKSFLHGWTGDAASAEQFIDYQAQEYASEVDWERTEFGATDWDDA